MNASFLENRIIFSDNGTLNDLSVNLNDFQANSETLAIVAADDKLFIGAPIPFNHKYILMDTVNTASSNTTVDLWNGNDDFKAAVDVVDQTSVSGATLGQSGYLSWVTDKNEGWLREDTSGTQGTNEEVTGLTDIVIYDLYWQRLNFSGDLDAGTKIKFIGSKFSEDSDLRLRYRDIFDPDIIDKIASGKTTYDDEHFLAAQEIIKDLKTKGVIVNSGQILDWHLFTEPAVHKVSQIIFNNFGKIFREEEKKAQKDYTNALDLALVSIDRDNNARISPLERTLRQGWMTR